MSDLFRRSLLMKLRSLLQSVERFLSQLHRVPRSFNLRTLSRTMSLLRSTPLQTIQHLPQQTFGEIGFSQRGILCQPACDIPLASLFVNQTIKPFKSGHSN